MSAQRWKQVRALFDEVSELPREQWQSALGERCDDAAIREEVEQLLRSQTVGLSRVSNRLDEALARAFAPELGVGQRLGPWRLVERIAQGGMGTVFKAQRDDGLYQRIVAIKLLHGLPGAAEAARLAVERQVLADLQLPQVARLYDGGTTPDGHPYLVMEYVEGEPLDRWCAARPLHLEQRLRLFLEVCSIVQAAHERLVLHCDLKPGNVLVKPDGQPVLLDFGLARALNEAGANPESGFCTPAYASPEMISGQALGVASDVYSLGVMLVELLSMRAVEREPGDIASPVPLPSAFAGPTVPWRRQLPGDLDAVARTACALDVTQRYRSVEALIADVRRYLDMEPVIARRGGRLYRLHKALRRHRKGVLTATAAVLVLSAFVVGLAHTRRQAQEEAAIARQVSNFMVGVFETADPFLRTELRREELSPRQLLDRAAAQLSHDLANAPAELARMRGVLGVAYQNSGLPQQAEVLLQQAYAGFLAPAVNRPDDAASVLADLSLQKTLEGNGRMGVRMADQGLALLGSRGPAMTRARLLAAKGTALTNQQAYHDAEMVLQQATALYAEDTDPLAPVKQLELSYTKGLMYLRWGRQHEAEAQFRHVLGSAQGRRTSLTLASEVRLAQVLREQGHFAQALALLRGGMQQTLDLYGPNSRFVLVRHDGLADVYRDSGDYIAADREYAERHRLSALLDGTDSVEYSMGLYNHAELLQLRGAWDEAEPLYRQALALRVAKLGADSPTALRAESGLGLLLLRQGRLDEAGPLLEHADAGLAAALPVDAPGRMEARLNRVEWLVRAGHVAQAATLFGELPAAPTAALELRRLRAQAALADALGQTQRAGTLWREALALARKHHGDRSRDAAVARLALAGHLLRLGQSDTAMAELHRARPVLQKLQGPQGADLLHLQEVARAIQTAGSGG